MQFSFLHSSKCDFPLKLVCFQTLLIYMAFRRKMKYTISLSLNTKKFEIAVVCRLRPLMTENKMFMLYMIEIIENSIMCYDEICNCNLNSL